MRLKQTRKSVINRGAVFAVILSLMSAARAQRAINATSHRLVEATPESVGMSGDRLARIDDAIRESISRKETPGAVVLVARKGRIVYRKAFGDRAIEPKPEPMTVDTIFDLASLTKVVATATSVMILVERGKVSLADPVALYIPQFGKNGKERVTVEQLVTHRAGLPPDNEIADYAGRHRSASAYLRPAPELRTGNAIRLFGCGFHRGSRDCSASLWRPLGRFRAEEHLRAARNERYCLQSSVCFFQTEEKHSRRRSARRVD
jgi:CubicO group peptidase (beta-lactamase class C family)